MAQPCDPTAVKVRSSVPGFRDALVPDPDIEIRQLFARPKYRIAIRCRATTCHYWFPNLPCQIGWYQIFMVTIPLHPIIMVNLRYLPKKTCLAGSYIIPFISKSFCSVLVFVSNQLVDPVISISPWYLLSFSFLKLSLLFPLQSSWIPMISWIFRYSHEIIMIPNIANWLENHYF